MSQTLQGIEPLTLLVQHNTTELRLSTWLPHKEVTTQCEGEGGCIFVMCRVNFIYTCKRHHLEYCKPPTPHWAAVGCAPDSPNKPGPGGCWIPSFRGEGGGDMVCIQRGRRRSKFSSRFLLLLHQFERRPPKSLQDWTTGFRRILRVQLKPQLMQGNVEKDIPVNQLQYVHAPLLQVIWIRAATISRHNH